MANTQILKEVIEPELAEAFLKQHSARRLTCGRVLGMDYDLIAFSEGDLVLWLCEITASGYLGKGSRDFHVGAVRKFCEGSAKFAIAARHEQDVKNQIRVRYPEISPSEVRCHFIVPQGSRFIRALGWRRQLLGANLMHLEELGLSENSQRLLEQVLLQSRREQDRSETVLSKPPF